MTERKKRGFAAMDPERQRKLASEGGKAAHKAGTAHQWTEEEGKAAAKKGAAIRWANHRRK